MCPALAGTSLITTVSVGWVVGRVVCNALTFRAPIEHLKLSHGCKSRICARQGHYHPSQWEFEPLGRLAWGDREQTSKSTTVSHAKIYTYNTHSPPSAVMAEWLRRRARNLLGYRRAGSNLVRSGSFSIFFFFFFVQAAYNLCPNSPCSNFPAYCFGHSRAGSCPGHIRCLLR